MILRAAGPADAEALAQVHASAFPTPWPASDIAGFAAAVGAFALMIETLDGAPGGFILCRAIAGEAEILTLAVRPEHRRRGWASALVQAAASQAAPSAASLFLEVAADNPAAIALYRGAGFEAVGRRRGYYARPDAPAVDALVMRRTLNT